MAFFSGTVHSECLAADTCVNVILPQKHDKKMKTLYLLHGIYSNHTAWTRYTRIEAYADQFGYSVVMPDAGNSFYADMRHGGQYFTYITSELPDICARLFGFSGERDETFVAGLSMGGYGALKCALTFPESYRAAASFSGACDINGIMDTLLENNDKRALAWAGGVWGEGMRPGMGDDLFPLACAAAKRAVKNPLLMTCGLSDALLDSNRRFYRHLTALGFNCALKEWPGGHSWDFWDASIMFAMKYFDKFA